MGIAEVVEWVGRFVNVEVWYVDGVGRFENGQKMSSFMDSPITTQLNRGGGLKSRNFGGRSL